MKEAQRTVPIDADRPMTQMSRQWSSPQLVRLGTIAEVTSKIDRIGRNDGGSGLGKRT